MSKTLTREEIHNLRLHLHNLFPHSTDEARKGFDALCDMALSSLRSPVSEEPYLQDCADGVRGHYCIARTHVDGSPEFWSEGKWVRYGAEVFELGKKK